MCVGVRSCTEDWWDEFRIDYWFDGVGAAAYLPGVRFVAPGEVLTMTVNGWLQILLFFAIILLITKPMGVFIAHVFNREKTFLDPVLRPVERLIYRLTGVDEQREMRWTEYT